MIPSLERFLVLLARVKIKKTYQNKQTNKPTHTQTKNPRNHWEEMKEYYIAKLYSSHSECQRRSGKNEFFSSEKRKGKLKMGSDEFVAFQYIEVGLEQFLERKKGE